MARISSYKTTNCSATGRSFTLIEVLTVMAITGLLLGILLPSLSRAQSESKRAKCLSNLRSLMSAATAYASDDPHDLILPAHPISDTNVLHDEGYFDYGGATGSRNVWNGSRFGPESPRTAATRPLNALLYPQGIGSETFSLFRCPSDRPLPHGHETTDERFYSPGMEQQTMFESVGTSYGGNAYRAWEEADGTYVSVGPFLRPSHMVPTPADTVIFYDALLYYNFIYVPQGTSGYLRSQGVNGWHEATPRYSVAFADGHADIIRLPGGPLWDLRVSGGPKEALWLRGPGFRFDCLPSPPILDLPKGTRGKP